MRILVTGGGGFIGSHLIRLLLEEGHEVHSFSRGRQEVLRDQPVTIHRGDLLDAETVRGVCSGMDAVFHVAARAGVWGPRAVFEAANVTGTAHLLSAARQAGVRYFIHTSTPSVVFNGGPFRGEDETLPYGRNWLCHYAETKARAEAAVLSADDPAGEGSGMRTLAIRPHLVYGPGDPHILPRVIERARAGKLKIVGDGTNRVDISYVENVAHAHRLALAALVDGKAGGKAYFVSDGQAVVLWDWINTVLQRLGVPPVRRRIPQQLAYGAGGIMEVLWKTFSLGGEPPMTRFVATELAKDHFFSIEAARRDLGYAPPVHPEEALARTVASLEKPG